MCIRMAANSRRKASACSGLTQRDTTLTPSLPLHGGHKMQMFMADRSPGDDGGTTRTGPPRPKSIALSPRLLKRVPPSLFYFGGGTCRRW